MNENELCTRVLDAAFVAHRRLGPGLLESVYEAVLEHLLTQDGIPVERQVPIPIEFDGLRFNEGFRADLLVGGSVIVEVKSVEAAQPVHKKQLLTYLRLSDRRLGVLVNFGQTRLADGIERLANGMPG